MNDSDHSTVCSPDSRIHSIFAGYVLRYSRRQDERGEMPSSKEKHISEAVPCAWHSPLQSAIYLCPV